MSGKEKNALKELAYARALERGVGIEKVGGGTLCSLFWFKYEQIPNSVSICLKKFYFCVIKHLERSMSGESFPTHVLVEECH